MFQKATFYIKSLKVKNVNLSRKWQWITFAHSNKKWHEIHFRLFESPISANQICRKLSRIGNVRQSLKFTGPSRTPNSLMDHKLWSKGYINYVSIQEHHWPWFIFSDVLPRWATSRTSYCQNLRYCSFLFNIFSWQKISFLGGFFIRVQFCFSIDINIG